MKVRPAWLPAEGLNTEVTYLRSDTLRAFVAEVEKRSCEAYAIDLGGGATGLRAIGHKRAMGKVLAEFEAWVKG